MSAMECYNTSCDDIAATSSDMSATINSLQVLPLGYQAVEGQRDRLHSLKASQHKLGVLLESAETSAASLESVCGSSASAPQRQKCEGECVSTTS